MEVFWWILAIVGALILATLGISYVCFRMTFYISDKEKKENALWVRGHSGREGYASRAAA